MMRRADPSELTIAAVPLLTAHVSESELAEWVPVSFDLIDDPLQTPEPSLGALVALESGQYFVLYYGRISGQLTVEIPSTSDPSTAVEALFEEIPLPAGRVLWHRPDVQLSVATRPDRGTNQGPGVLVVNSDPPDRRLIFEVLLAHDISSDATGSIRVAMRMLDRHSYAAVILDTAFPPAHLVELMRHLRNMPASRRPIVLAVSSDDKEARNLEVDLVHAVVRRPFDLEVLIDLVTSYIEQQQRVPVSIASTHTNVRPFKP
jgi:CheY-like chemotaxis protein